MTDKKTIYAAYKSGNTYAAIAIKYSITRNQVAAAIRDYRKALQSNSCKEVKMITPEPANDAIPPPIQINTVEEWLFSDRCRYIAGEGDNRTFCGHVKKRGHQWCEEHHKLCKRPVVKK